MKRTTIFLREEIEGDLRAIARRQGLPVAEVVREALDEYVSRAKKRPAASPGFVGIGASGRRDVAGRHEELLWKGLGPHEGAPPSRARVPGGRATSSGRRRRSS
jgi:hypothetical protein